MEEKGEGGTWRGRHGEGEREGEEKRIGEGRGGEGRGKKSRGESVSQGEAFVPLAGEHCWPVAAQELPYPDILDKYKLFAQFLLQGKVGQRCCAEQIQCMYRRSGIFRL